MDAALLQCLTIRFQAFARLGKLRQPALQYAVGIRVLAATQLEFVGLAAHAVLLGGQIVLSFLELPNRRLEDGAAFEPLRPIARILFVLGFRLPLPTDEILLAGG